MELIDQIKQKAAELKSLQRDLDAELHGIIVASYNNLSNYLAKCGCNPECWNCRDARSIFLRVEKLGAYMEIWKEPNDAKT